MKEVIITALVVSGVFITLNVLQKPNPPFPIGTETVIEDTSIADIEIILNGNALVDSAPYSASQVLQRRLNILSQFDLKACGVEQQDVYVLVQNIYSITIACSNQLLTTKKKEIFPGVPVEAFTKDDVTEIKSKL